MVENKLIIKVFFLILLISSIGFVLILNSKSSKSPSTNNQSVSKSQEQLNQVAFLPTDFAPQQSPTFKVKTKDSMDTVKANTVVLDSTGRETNAYVDVKEANDGKQIVVSPTNSFVPGKYKVETTLESGQKFDQDFTWGVLAINPNKSTYSPNETAKLSLAVLDEKGMMVCDAILTLVITAPNGETITLTTTDGSIKVNPECKVKDITVNPDYEASFTPKTIGKYQMSLSATTPNGTYKILDFFEISNTNPFSIERQTATRIFPSKVYPVLIKVTANEDFKGEITEQVPESFTITQTTIDTPHTSIDTKPGLKRLVWNVNLKKGQTVNLGYNYKAPDISPQFYLLGPLALTNTQNQTIYQEPRYWQIASDAINFVGNIATAQSKTSGSTLVLTIGAGGVTAGNTIIVSVVNDATCFVIGIDPFTSGVNTISNSITDTAGNSYTKNLEKNNENAFSGSDCTGYVGTISTAVWSANNINALSNGDTITITFDNPSAGVKAATAMEVSGLKKISVLDQSHGAYGSGTAANTGAQSSTTYNNEILVGAIGVNGPGGDSFTAGTNYTTAPPTRIGTTGGSSASNWTINPEYRIVSSTGTYDATATLGTSRDWVAGFVSYVMADVPVIPISTQFSGVRLSGTRIN